MLDWGDLRFFLALFREGNFMRAGEALRVDHTTVSRRLRMLEKVLGARLFHRHPDGVMRLTEAGERMIASAQSIESQILSIGSTVGREDARIDGVVRIGTAHTLAARLVVPTLAKFRRLHPELTFEVRTGPASFDLPRREADLVLRFSRPKESGLIVKKMADIGFGFYASTDYLHRHGKPSNPDDLSGHDVIAYESTLFVPGGRELDSAARNARIVLQCDQILSALAACSAGLGITALPCFIAADDPTLVPIRHKITHETLWLVVHPDLQSTARVRVVIETLTTLFEEHVPALRDGSLTIAKRRDPPRPARKR